MSHDLIQQAHDGQVADALLDHLDPRTTVLADNEATDSAFDRRLNRRPVPHIGSG